MFDEIPLRHGFLDPCFYCRLQLVSRALRDRTLYLGELQTALVEILIHQLIEQEIVDGDSTCPSARAAQEVGLGS